MLRMAREYITIRLSILMIMFLCGGWGLWHPAESRAEGYENISVIHPNVPEPFNGIINKIIEGIESRSDSKIKRFKLNNDNTELKGWLEHNQIKVAIALGNSAYGALKKSQYKRSLVIGAVVSPPKSGGDGAENPITISYAPSPDLLFKNLKQVSPNTKTVHVVYNAKSNQWLIDEAIIAAKKTGHQLKTYQATDLKSGAKIYRTVLKSLSGVEDSLWLIQDRSTFSDKDMLPNILQEAWTKKFVLFSSNLAHVKKGALFALYPDNEKLGNRLAKIADEIAKKSGYSGDALQSLKDIKIAVNTRSASNIGIGINKKFRSKVDLTFPKSR